MRSFNQKEKVLFICCVAALLVYLVVQKVGIPLQKDGFDFKAKIQQAKEELNKNNQLTQQAKENELAYQSLVKSFGVYANDPEEFSRLASLVEMSAKNNNIQITNQQVLKAEDYGGLRHFPVMVDIQGQWEDLHHFIYSVQSTELFIDLDELNFQNSKDQAGLLKMHLKMSFKRVLK